MSTKNVDGQNFLTGPADAGQRIDRFLSDNLIDVSRSRIQKLIIGGKVLVRGKCVSKHYRLLGGDMIDICGLSTESGQADIEPEAIDLKIIYEDPHMLIISKEAGMLVHPASGNNEHTLVNALLYHCRDLSRLSGDDRAGIVHRLDRDTSGLLIVAKSESVHTKLSDMFKNRTIKKTYIALVAGRFEEENGHIDLPIGRSRMDRKKMAIAADRGRQALTDFEVAQELGQATLLNIFPGTGRTHQIRVHMSYIGHPIIADKIYGNSGTARLAKIIGLKRQFLHAAKLKFAHPVSGKEMEFTDKLPEDLAGPLKRLRGEYVSSNKQ